MVAQSRGLALTPATLGAVQGVATRIGVAGGTRGRFVRVMARDLAAFGLSDSDQVLRVCVVSGGGGRGLVVPVDSSSATCVAVFAGWLRLPSARVYCCLWWATVGGLNLYGVLLLRVVGVAGLPVLLRVLLLAPPLIRRLRLHQ
jgi:hypothetical protein